MNNLQSKVEFFAQENDALGNEINELRSEIIQLKTILYTHRDCPHSRSQLQSGVMDQIARDLEQAGVIGGLKNHHNRHHPPPPPPPPHHQQPQPPQVGVMATGHRLPSNGSGMQY